MTGRSRPCRPRTRHTARLLVAALALVAVGSFGSQLGAGAQSPGVVRGGANASADSMGFQIINAGASLGWTFGRSTAAYRDVTSSSEGKAVDLGALEALLGQPQCHGEVPPALNLETLPPRTIADSAVKGSEVEKSTEVIYPRLAGDRADDRVVGTQRASASKTPASRSSTETLDQDFGFFRVEGATSHARTSFKDGIRLAEAEMSADRIVVFGGQIVFNEPKWSAKAFSGAKTGSEADFTFRSARVFGNHLSGSVLERDLLVFETLVEGLLAPLGLDLEFPEVRQPFGAVGIEVTPLSVSMSDAPIGEDLLIPLLDTKLLENYRKDSVSEDCRRETFWTIIDALERALGGSGSVKMLVGGATATTDDTDYSFKPFEAPAPIAAAPPVAAQPTEVPADLDPGAGFDDYGSDFVTDDYGSDFGDDFGTDFDTSFDDDLGDLGGSELGTVGEEIPAEVLAEDEVEPDTKGADRTEGREIAAGSSDVRDDNTAAVIVGIAALLGALGLSMGDRIMGLRARRRIT